MGDLWRLADRLREYRGDAHIVAWSAAGFDATEIGLLTELYWGLPLRTYLRTRAWSDADLDAAEERLEARGLVSGRAFTEEGRAAREQVELVTDELCRPLLEALGDDVDELVGILGPWGDQIKAAGGYPGSRPPRPRRPHARRLTDPSHGGPRGECSVGTARIRPLVRLARASARA